MNIVKRERDGILVFELAGRIDTEGAEDLHHALQAAVDAGKHKLVLDMEDVGYISSAGLRTLADILSTSQDNGGDLKLVGLNRKVLRVMQVIGFDKFFAIHTSTDAALAAFQPVRV